MKKTLCAIAVTATLAVPQAQAAWAKGRTIVGFRNWGEDGFLVLDQATTGGPCDNTWAYLPSGATFHSMLSVALAAMLSKRTVDLYNTECITIDDKQYPVIISLHLH